MNDADQFEPFSLRIPTNLRDRIRKSAVANRRSINAEMLVLMEQSLAEASQKESA